MLERDMLVRVLASAETTGEVTCLLLDKTGTLTVNEQRVRRAWIAGVDVGPLDDDLDDAARTETIARDVAALDDAVVTLASILLAINTTVTRDAEGTILRGSRQEIALLRFVQSLNGDDESFATTILAQFPLVKLFPFTAERKRMCTLFMLRDGVEDEEAGGRVVIRAAVKGAAQDILSQCSTVLNARGKKRPLDDTTRSTLSRAFESWQRDAERVLLIAYRDVERDHVSPRDATTMCERMSVEDAESRLVLVAAVGMSDPIRPEAPKSVATCRRAGVDVKMVTGDSLSTAVAVARRCGILDDDDDVSRACMTGEEFRERVVDQASLDAVWPDLRVLARASPADKYALTNGIRASTTRRGRQVVGVVGDGTNDAPALRRSDVGFALGSGTETAREASDIVLLRDDVASVVEAIGYGRNVFQSIEKFIAFQLTANVTCVVVSVGGALAYSRAPLSAIELLFVNLVIDSLASLALATDPPSDDALRRRPADAAALVDDAARVNIVAQVAYQLCVVRYLMDRFGPDDAQIFTAFVLMQLANQCNCRATSNRIDVFAGVGDNPLFVALLAAEILLVVVIVQRGGAVFHTRPLDVGEWCRCVAFALGSLPLRTVAATFLVSLAAAIREDARLLSSRRGDGESTNRR